MKTFFVFISKAHTSKLKILGWIFLVSGQTTVCSTLEVSKFTPFNLCLTNRVENRGSVKIISSAE